MVSLSAPAVALNKQSQRQSEADGTDKPPVFNLSGFIFAGGFLFNPTYAARPDNSGLALLRFGLHLDLDLYRRYLTLSYDENTFTDGAAESPNPIYPSEHDHIVGLLTNIDLPHHLTLTLATHLEIDAIGFGPNTAYRQLHPDCTPGGRLLPPACFDPHYSQSYVDAYARIAYTRPRLLLFAALGGFLYNPSYAARPDNAGLALLRYVLHGEFIPLPWLALRLDLNFFTDRDEFPLQPTELDTTTEVAVRWREFELRFIGEADLPVGAYPLAAPHPSATPGLKQFYMATLLQWNFDLSALRKR